MLANNTLAVQKQDSAQQSIALSLNILANLPPERRAEQAALFTSKTDHISYILRIPVVCNFMMSLYEYEGFAVSDLMKGAHFKEWKDTIGMVCTAPVRGR